MKCLLLAAVFALLAAVALTATTDDEDWAAYKKQYDKMYKDEAEDKQRREIYLEARDFIREHNKRFEKGDETFKVDINVFTDWTNEEKLKLHGSRLPADLEIVTEISET